MASHAQSGIIIFRRGTMPRIDRSALNICAIAAGAATISHVIIICYHLINRPGKHLFIYGAGARASH